MLTGVLRDIGPAIKKRVNKCRDRRRWFHRRSQGFRPSHQLRVKLSINGQRSFVVGGVRPFPHGEVVAHAATERLTAVRSSVGVGQGRARQCGGATASGPKRAYRSSERTEACRERANVGPCRRPPTLGPRIGRPPGMIPGTSLNLRIFTKKPSGYGSPRPTRADAQTYFARVTVVVELGALVVYLGIGLQLRWIHSNRLRRCDGKHSASHRVEVWNNGLLWFASLALGTGAAAALFAVPQSLVLRSGLPSAWRWIATTAFDQGTGPTFDALAARALVQVGARGPDGYPHLRMTKGRQMARSWTGAKAYKAPPPGT